MQSNVDQSKLPPAAQSAIDAKAPEQHQRWFNNNPDRIVRAVEAGYAFVNGNDGKPVTRVIGSDGSTQVLMTTAKIERNLLRHPKFIKLLARRNPRIQERILRLNTTIEEGARVRGWQPGHTAKLFCLERGCLSYNEFRKTFRPEMWRALPPKHFIKHGKRKYLRMDMMAEDWIGAVLRAGVTETIL